MNSLQTPCPPTLSHHEFLTTAEKVIICFGEADEADVVNEWLKVMDRYPATVATALKTDSKVTPEVLKPLFRQIDICVVRSHEQRAKERQDQCLKILHGNTGRLRFVILPKEFNNFLSWKAAGATFEDFSRLLKATTTYQNCPGIKSHKYGQNREGMESHDLLIASAAQVAPQSVKWLYQDRIPCSGVTFIGGDPATAKSSLLHKILAESSTGHLPGSFFCQPCHSLLLTAEDDLHQVVLPRLIAHGANLDNVGFSKIQQGGSLVLPRDFDNLRQMICDQHISLVVFDPISAFIDVEVNTWNDSMLRSLILTPLNQLAQQMKIAIVAIIHLNKDAKREARYRFNGSIATLAASRSSFLMVRDPHKDNEVLLCHLKSNLGRLAPTQQYRLEASTIQYQDHTIQTTIVNLIGTSDLTADEALNASTSSRPTNSQTDSSTESAFLTAKVFLLQSLGSGPVWSRTICRDAEDQHISDRTLRRVKKALMIKSGKSQHASFWYLPGHEGRLPQTPPPSDPVQLGQPELGQVTVTPQSIKENRQLGQLSNNTTYSNGKYCKNGKDSNVIEFGQVGIGQVRTGEEPDRHVLNPSDHEGDSSLLIEEVHDEN